MNVNESFLAGLVDDLTKMLENLSINNMGKQIVLHNGSSHGALIPSKRRTRKEKPPDVIPDEDTMKIWMQLMEENGSHTTEEEYWEEQRQIFCGRVDLFIKCMHIIQGYILYFLDCNYAIITCFYSF